MSHEIVLKRAIELAKLGLGSVSPNPMVGAIVVENDEIIGEGYHQKYGKAHAEVNAIHQVLDTYVDAAERLKRSIIYVTLEPCSHFGKTPPCADLIIKYQIPKVVIGCLDPFESVNGKGVAQLKAARIEVISGILENECEQLNKRFFTRVKKQRPYVILKWAQTSDGYLAPDDGEQKWISGDAAKRLVHLWRTQEDCVLVGKNTALIDNPKLNVRLADGRNPKRAVIDRDLVLPNHLHLFNQESETFIFNALKTDREGKTLYVAIEDFDHFLPQYILFQLYLQDIQSLIIEGGAQTLKTFIDANLWDEARIFTSTESWGSGIKAPEIKGRLQEKIKVGNDQLSTFKPH
ncbi:MAG: bifunctional diaminohydroxyphosphoribosylaminopyrimidine deaminase/5-amino-6-(5-phosphoribosylamino)uracil reductase RibD [Bacteroidetes bacterium]|nr:bifunctional diaminohydroxyphosphoribosylaminopyrimidine deaminase/5-amino-6-(5-phosphoribosylamino)uracil reductase RibD [Bacteroidota bacterium]MBU1371621.1 bifunctional diaminohydroxyphosphoribosylaminopyrimidine deaminase/5-amino-6-(5-phosphoribosylamino)uracil reductase RibD [Bacteroidota bacterium]MBU1486197.1 bifunctional diaminohydroxyphosphoribosylaminopyrimidine deaminase/5-amino-6-(5-phosphoribosylamino)uracil reductase RibD [Bacteroidota bacterium]MBU1761964.1 bifunctional diamino